MMKPDIGGEETGKRSRRTLRGGKGQRAWIDRSRNLGDPAEGGNTNTVREDIPDGGSGRESDRLIVAKKRVMIVEQRGLTENMLK